MIAPLLLASERPICLHSICSSHSRAYVEAAAALVLFLKFFECELDPEADWTPPLYGVSVTLTAKRGMPVRLRRRQHA